MTREQGIICCIMRFSVRGGLGIASLRDPVRTYFELGGHPIQFNMIGGETLREAQADPEKHWGRIPTTRLRRRRRTRIVAGANPPRL